LWQKLEEEEKNDLEIGLKIQRERKRAGGKVRYRNKRWGGGRNGGT
jgi:hypothetical protein